nr:hypothetical protein [Candidatus Sigynarchaeota archaeon]
MRKLFKPFKGFNFKVKLPKLGHATRILILLIIIIVPVAIAVIGLFSPINLTPRNFQPIQATSWRMNIFSGVDLVGNAGSNTPITHWEPGNTLYPRVDVFFSQPYLSDVFGNPIESRDDAPVQKLVINGVALFYHEYYYTVDIGARTYTNLPTVHDTTVYLNPFVGDAPSHLYDGQYGYPPWSVGKPSAHPMPNGCLAYILNTDQGILEPYVGDPRAWGYMWASGGAKISSSLEYIDYTIGKHVGAAGSSYADAITKIQTRYGNSRVTVRPQVDIHALSDYISYTYTTSLHLDNGTDITITMDQTSAQVGFISATRTDDSNIKGTIPNTAPGNTGMSVNEPTVGRTNSYMNDRFDKEVDDVVTVTGNVEYAGDYAPVTVTGAAEPNNIVMGLPNVPHIELDNLVGSLPQVFSPTAEFMLQPFSTVNVAHMTVDYESYEYDPYGFDRYDVPKTGSADLQVPYAITIQNDYAMSKATVKVGVITACEMQIVTSAGKPVDPALFTDFELNSIINNPAADTLHVGVTAVTPDPWKAIGAFFASLFSNIWNIIIMAIVILIVIGVGYVMFKKILRRH